MSSLSTITVAFVSVTASALLRLLLLLLLLFGLLRLRSGRQRAGCCFLLPFCFSLAPISSFSISPNSVSSAGLWVFSTLSSSRACSAALLVARHTRRRPRAVCMCGPLSTRIHLAFLHPAMCPFGTYVVSFSQYPPLKVTKGLLESLTSSVSSSRFLRASSALTSLTCLSLSP